MKAREAYRAKTPEERRAWTARRDPEKVKASDKARYYRDPEGRKTAARAYHQENRERVYGHKKKWVERNPEKRRAHVIVSNAIRDGKLVKGPCEREREGTCRGRVQAHHDDYSKPLEVRWFCAGHHGETRRAAA